MPKYQFKNLYFPSYSTSGSTDSGTPDSFDFKDVDIPTSGDDSNHDKWIDVLSTDWDINNPTGSDGYTATDDLWVRDARDDPAADPLPAEDFKLGYDEIEWTY